jgi:hypothetical protein
MSKFHYEKYVNFIAFPVKAILALPLLNKENRSSQHPNPSKFPPMRVPSLAWVDQMDTISSSLASLIGSFAPGVNG